MTCQQLKAEKVRIGMQQADLGPTLIPMHEEPEREAKLSELSGDAKAIDKVLADNRCG